MSMSTLLFLVIRGLHVLLAAMWLGAAVFMSYVLMPVLATSGPAGGQVMIRLNRKGLVPFFASLGGMTVLSGIYLYWRFTDGFSPEMSRTNAGMAFGIGGVAGIIALIIGGSVVGRNSKKIVELMERATTLPDGSEKSALMQQASGLGQRVASAGTMVVILQIIALLTMAVGHYI